MVRFVATGVAAVLLTSNIHADTSQARIAQMLSRAPAVVLQIPPAAPAQPTGAAAAMDPVAKGAIIGAAVGVGSISVFAWWFCTQGPGECSGENWPRPLLVFAGIGAGAGALIGLLLK